MTDQSSIEMMVNPHAVTRISVEKLFGQFTYQFPSKNGESADLSHLFLLYGDNGSGKTTILRLLFHLLSPEDGRGHKSEVAKVRFKRFAVDLADGTTIEALRTGRAQDGPYRAAILKGSETIDAIELPLEPSPGEVKEEKKPRLRAFLEKLGRLRIALHFLSDDRRIQGRMTDEEMYQRRRYREMMASGVITATFVSHFEEERTPGVALKPAIQRATQWINHQAYKSSNTGQRKCPLYLLRHRAAHCRVAGNGPRGPPATRGRDGPPTRNPVRTQRGLFPLRSDIRAARGPHDWFLKGRPAGDAAHPLQRDTAVRPKH